MVLFCFVVSKEKEEKNINSKTDFIDKIQTSYNIFILFHLVTKNDIEEINNFLITLTIIHMLINVVDPMILYSFLDYELIALKTVLILQYFQGRFREEEK